MIEKTKLRSLFGIHPVIVYCAYLIFLFLVVGVIPSFLTDSRRIYIESNIEPLYLEVDGISAAMTPTNLRLKAGKHTICLYYADDCLYKGEIRVKHALFYSYIFEYRQKLNINSISLTDRQKNEITKDFLDEAVMYSTLFQTFATQNQKPIFSYYKSLLGSDVDKGAVEFAKNFIANVELAEDYKKNFDMTYEFKGFDNELKKEEDIISLNVHGLENYGNFQFVKFDKFSVLKNEVSTQMFLDFLNDKEYYNAKNTNELIRKKYVDENYLKGVDFSKNESVFNISYKVADEFCKWFSEKYNVKARLLTKKEYSSIYPHKVKFQNLDYGLYELTSTFFIPSLIDKKDSEINISAEFSDINMKYVLFSSSVYNKNRTENDRLSLIGVIDEDQCFETVGFRFLIENE